MARLTDLTRTLSHSTGVTQTSLAVIARVLREAGLVATGTRGPGAHMGPRDVASLLLAIAIQGPHLKAADLVKEVGAQKLLSVQHINATPVDFLGDDSASLGLHSGQDLIQAFSDILGRYTVKKPGAATPSPERAPRGAGGIAEIFKGWDEDIVLPQEERTPLSIKVCIMRRADDYFPEIKVSDSNGRMSALKFSRNGERPSVTTQDIGMESAVTIHPWAVHAAICCIRDLDISDHPFNRA